MYKPRIINFLNMTLQKKRLRGWFIIAIFTKSPFYITYFLKILEMREIIPHFELICTLLVEHKEGMVAKKTNKRCNHTCFPRYYYCDILALGSNGRNLKLED